MKMTVSVKLPILILTTLMVCIHEECILGEVVVKSRNLTVLALIPFTGNDPKDGKLCEAAMEVAFNAANNRSEILPNIQLIPEFKDEGGTSMQAVKHSVTMSRSAQTRNIAPIVIGPYFTPGCQKLASMIHYLNMTQLGIGCGANFFTANRKSYPNLYRHRASAEFDIPPRLTFVRTIGNWKRIAILTSAENVFDYTTATLFSQAATMAGVDVFWFNSVSAVTDDAIVSLKESDARIIMIDVGSKAAFVFSVVCQAYKFGITGSRYVFMAASQAFADPTTSTPPAGCSREIIMEQFRYTYWIGILTTAVSNNGKTSLGYDLKEFERMFDTWTNKTRSPDYSNRHLCHDAALQAIMALNNAEKLLGKQNKSLLEYSTNPGLVLQAVNESLSKSDFTGIRVGRTKYSARLEMDNEPHTIAQWNYADKLFRYVYVVRVADNTTEPGDNFSSVLTEIQPIRWEANGNRPPKDIWRNVLLIQDVQTEVLIIVLGIVGVFTLTKVSGIVFVLADSRRQEKQTDFSIFVKSKSLFIAAVLFLDAAAVIFAVKNDFASDVLCSAGPILTAIGISLFHGYLFATLSLINQKRSPMASFATFLNSAGMRVKSTFTSNKKRSPAKNKEAGSTKPTAPTQQATGNGLRSRTESNKSGNTPPVKIRPPPFVVMKNISEFKVVIIAVVFAIINAAIIITWMTIDPLTHRRTLVYKDPLFDPVTDTYTNVLASICQSSSLGTTWFTILAALNFVPLGIACYLSYSLRRMNSAEMSQEMFTECKKVRLTSVFGGTLFCATVLMLIVVSAPSTQQTVIAFTLLVESCCSFSIIFIEYLVYLGKLITCRHQTPQSLGNTADL